MDEQVDVENHVGDINCGLVVRLHVQKFLQIKQDRGHWCSEADRLARHKTRALRSGHTPCLVVMRSDEKLVWVLRRCERKRCLL